MELVYAKMSAWPQMYSICYVHLTLILHMQFNLSHTFSQKL